MKHTILKPPSLAGISATRRLGSSAGPLFMEAAAGAIFIGLFGPAPIPAEDHADATAP